MRKIFYLIRRILFIDKFKKYFLKSKFSQITYLVLDVDGVLTNGGLFVDNQNNIYKMFSVKDGLGLKLIQKNQIEIVLISGGNGAATLFRAKQLGIKYFFQNVKDKKQCLMDLQKELGFNSKNTAYIGDDLNDLPVRDIVEILISPKNACNELKMYSDLILSCDGGEGAVRELCEIILQSKNLFEKYCDKGFVDNND